MSSPNTQSTTASGLQDYANKLAAKSAQALQNKVINTNPLSPDQLAKLPPNIQPRIDALLPMDRDKFHSFCHAGIYEIALEFLSGCEMAYLSQQNKSMYGAGGTGPKSFAAMVDPNFQPSTPKNAIDMELAKFVTVNDAMIEMKSHARELAQLDYPVLITGPTGTGKELIARALGAQCGNRTAPMVSINCAGLPESLIESELFGHVKGAFTSAFLDKQGLFKKATRGTIFLDEFGELSMNMQAKLLRAIQEKSIRKVGSNDSEPIDCRIIVATNKNLVAEYKAGRFREDLYWRVAVFKLQTEGLKDRREDIVPILDVLDNPRRTTSKFGGKFPRDYEFTDEELTGNVRCLEAYVRRFQLFGKVNTQ